MMESSAEPEAGEASQDDQISLFDAAAYISDMSQQMAAMARQAGMLKAAAALELAHACVAEALAEVRGG